MPALGPDWGIPQQNPEIHVLPSQTQTVGGHRNALVRASTVRATEGNSFALAGDMDDKKLRIVLADSRRVESELIAGELRRHDLEVFLCEADPEPLLYCLERQEADVLI